MHTDTPIMEKQNRYLYAARAVDMLHWVVIAILLTGSQWLPSLLFGLFALTTLTLQILFFHCPLVVLESWLLQKHDSSYDRNILNRKSLTYLLYRRFGYGAVLVVSGIIIAAAIVLYGFSVASDLK